MNVICGMMLQNDSNPNPSPYLNPKPNPKVPQRPFRILFSVFRILPTPIPFLSSKFHHCHQIKPKENIYVEIWLRANCKDFPLHFFALQLQLVI